MNLSTAQLNTLGKIYQILTAKVREHEGATAAWIDPETNTIWMLGDEGELIRYTSDRNLFKDMSEEELRDLVALLQKMDEELLEGDHF
jgi:hypothetical protein